MLTKAELIDELNVATRLLNRIVGQIGDVPIHDPTWWREYYLFSGEHMICSDEGWEPGDSKQSYIDLAESEGVRLSSFIIDEVNAPALEQNLADGRA